MLLLDRSFRGPGIAQIGTLITCVFATLFLSFRGVLFATDPEWLVGSLRKKRVKLYSARLRPFFVPH